MKKINLKEEVSEIHISNVDDSSVILVKDKDLIVGTVVNDSADKWFFRLNDATESCDWCDNLVDLLKISSIKGYEFYVL